MKNKFKQILFCTALLSLLFVGCKASKSVDKKQEDRTVTEVSEKRTTRKGDTVRYEVPNIVFKDTVVTRTNYVTGTTQRLVFDDKGKLAAAECISGFIEIVEKNQKELIEAISEKQKEEEAGIDPVVILYAIVGLAIGVVIIFSYLTMAIRKQGKALTSIIERVT